MSKLTGYDLPMPPAFTSLFSTLDFRNTYQFDTLGQVTEIIQQNQAGGNAVTAKRAAFEYNKLNQRTLLTRYQSTGSSNLVGSTDSMNPPERLIDYWRKINSREGRVALAS